MKTLAALAALLATACGAELPRECADDRCEAAGSKDELLGQLEGYADPVARFLRDSVADDGTLAGDYKLVLDGVGTQLGCDAETEKHFVVLSNQGYTPKPILTRCASDALGASQFFAAMVATPEGDGIDPRQLHLASWDAEAGQYRRYQTTGTADGGMAINVEPAFCMGCHGGPEGLATWSPLMNEMASPWSNWNAHPGFVSQLYDEHFPQQYSVDATYRELTREAVLDSAASFEPIVRAGIQRVTSARLKTRTQAADARAALELVRPLFCDESTNYVSEVHDSGELRTAALVDDAIRSLYRSAGVAGAWSWLADSRMQLPPGSDPVTLIAVRGEATLQIELGLVARGVLSPVDVLRVRALDWKHPVRSPFRCGLHDAAMARLEAGELDAAIAASGATTVEGLIPAMFDAVMQQLVPATGDLLAIPDASESLVPSETTLAGFGDTLEAYVTSFQAPAMRATLRAERDRRACAVSGDPTAPLYANLRCP